MYVGFKLYKTITAPKDSNLCGSCDGCSGCKIKDLKQKKQ